MQAMARDVSSTGAHTARNIVFGLVLLIGGLVVAALTWITIFGAIFGILLAIVGLVVLIRLAMHARSADPTEGEGERPSE
jgi:hypothetical protein